MSPDSPDSGLRSRFALPRFFAELKRREVYPVIAVYGASSLVVLEAADLIVPLAGLPEWTIQAVLWAAVVGFPIAMVFAWVFDLTAEGVKRTGAARPGEIDEIMQQSAMARWAWGLLGLAGIGLFALGFWGGIRSGSGGDDGRSTATTPGAAYVAPADDPRPAIAVLPFADMSPERDQQYFSDGISEEILTALSRIRGLRVASRSSAFTYDARDADLRVVGADLGVPYLLAGTVRKDGDQVRITAELVNAADNFRLWSDAYDRRLESIFAVQSEIAGAIAEALRVPLGLSEDELVSPTLDMDVHDLYLSGRAAMRSRGTGVGEAIRLFEEATRRDSTWAPAWAGLSEAYAAYPLYSEAGAESADSALWASSLAAAEAAARRALEIDPSNASARVALGSTLRDSWEWAAAERELRHALQLDPDNQEAHLQYSEVLWGMGRLDEALIQTERALALDQAPVYWDVHGFVLYMNGRNAEAERALEEGMARDPDGQLFFLRTVDAQLLLMEGRYQEALERFSRFLPDSVAFRQLGEALERRDPNLVPDRVVRGKAQVLALLGETDRALHALEELVFMMPYRVQYDIWDPNLASVRDTERFRNVILPRVNLAGRTVHVSG
jgi:TolB-like protein/predicted Zn-dependent protease